MKITDYKSFEKVVGKDLANRIILEKVMLMIARGEKLEEIEKVVNHNGSIEDIREILCRK